MSVYDGHIIAEVLARVVEVELRSMTWAHIAFQRHRRIGPRVFGASHRSHSLAISA